MRSKLHWRGIELAKAVVSHVSFVPLTQGATVGSVWRSRGVRWNANRPINDSSSSGLSRNLGYRIQRYYISMIDQCEINKGKERERDCEGFTPTRRQSGDGKLRDLHCARRTHRWQPNKLSVGEFFMTLSLSLLGRFTQHIVPTRSRPLRLGHFGNPLIHRRYIKPSRGYIEALKRAEREKKKRRKKRRIFQCGRERAFECFPRSSQAKKENMSISNLKEIVEKGKVACPKLKVAIRIALWNVLYAIIF